MQQQYQTAAIKHLNMPAIVLGAVLLLAIIIFGITIPIVYNNAWNAGSSAGYTNGHLDGARSGYTGGHSDGYTQGKSDGYSTGQSDEQAVERKWFDQSCWSSTYYPNGTDYPAGPLGYFCTSSLP